MVLTASQCRTGANDHKSYEAAMSFLHGKKILKHWRHVPDRVVILPGKFDHETHLTVSKIC